MEEGKEIEENVELIAEQDAEEMAKHIETAERLKKTYNLKKIYLIQVEDEDTGEWYEAYFRKPNLKEFSMFTTIAQKGDRIQALQTLMKNIFVDGNKLVIEEDDLFLAAMSQIEDILSVQASKIKKL